MTAKRKEQAALLALFLLLACLYSVLPSLGLRVFASPDETATAESAKQIISHARVFVPENLASVFPWLHPRSWVSVGEKIAPVGFLGWSFFLSIFVTCVGVGGLPLVGALVVLSSVWPFYRLLRRFGQAAAWWGTLVTYTFPTVILYANRSLFPNGGMIALGIWSLFFIDLFSRRSVKLWMMVALGVLLGATVAIRPIELLWMLPWWIWAGWKWRPSRNQWLAMLGGAMIVCIPLAIFATKAYGHVWAIGYWTKENLISSELNRAITLSQGRSTRSSVFSFLPYGLDLQVLVWNVLSFFGRKLWLWTIVMLAVIVLFWYGRRQTAVVRRRETPFWLAVWTILALLFIYGGGLYHDRFGPVVATIGNSFLRYFLPVAWLGGLGFAYVWRRSSWRLLVPWLLPMVAVSLVGFGVYQAMAADDEGLWFTRKELIRYSMIREQVQDWFHPEDLILSERSDKIFFPALRSVSPLPPKQEVARLIREKAVQVGLFIRPLSQEDKDAWREVGLDAQELGSFSRERLYRLVLIKP